MTARYLVIDGFDTVYKTNDTAFAQELSADCLVIDTVAMVKLLSNGQPDSAVITAAEDTWER